MNNKKAKKEKKEFNLPAYINTPFFLYQDNRLDKPATLLAGFFYSLHTANKDISVSTDYVCSLLKVTDRHVYRILNQLEELRYISRSGSTNNRMINWIYNVSANIIITESNETTDTQDTSLQTTDTDVSSSSTTDTQVSKLLTHRSVNYCPAGHTYIKEDTKDITTTTVVVGIDQKKPKKPTPSPQLSVVISIQADDRLLKAYRDTPIDSPYFITDTDFLMCCMWHIDHREKHIHENGRIKAMIGWIKKGTFEIPKEWIKSRGKVNKNHEDRERIQQEASMKKYEKDMKEYNSRPKKDIELVPQNKKIKSSAPQLEFMLNLPRPA